MTVKSWGSDAQFTVSLNLSKRWTKSKIKVVNGVFTGITGKLPFPSEKGQKVNLHDKMIFIVKLLRVTLNCIKWLPEDHSIQLHS